MEWTPRALESDTDRLIGDAAFKSSRRTQKLLRNVAIGNPLITRLVIQKNGKKFPKVSSGTFHENIPNSRCLNHFKRALITFRSPPPQFPTEGKLQSEEITDYFHQVSPARIIRSERGKVFWAQNDERRVQLELELSHFCRIRAKFQTSCRVFTAFANPSFDFVLRALRPRDTYMIYEDSDSKTWLSYLTY